MKTCTAILTLITAYAGGSGVSLAAGDFQSHQSILDSAQQFLLGHPDIKRYPETTIEMGHIDSRMQLSPCDQPLETYLAPGGRLAGKTTVGVRCSTPKPWALYVPATVMTYATVYQTAQPLPRDHIIETQDLIAVKTELSGLNRGYYTNIQDLVGKQTRRSLPQSQTLNPGHVKPPLWVKRGETVALVASNPKFSIRMHGQALSDGAKGEQIRVKNLSSSRIVEGIVTAQGTVTVMN